VRESKIEAYATKCIEALGGEIRKVKWIGRANAPDRVIMYSGLTVWPEFKATGEKPRPAQVREHTRMRNQGQLVLVIDSMEKVDTLVEYLISHRKLIVPVEMVSAREVAEMYSRDETQNICKIKLDV